MTKLTDKKMTKLTDIYKPPFRVVQKFPESYEILDVAGGPFCSDMSKEEADLLAKLLN